MAKRYNPKILSELTESAFFHSPAPESQDSELPEEEAISQTPLQPDSPSPIEKVGSTSEPSQRSNERTNERSRPRRKIRHTFDIYADQLHSLREIALNREAETGDRVLLGDLAQEALDMLVSKEKNKK